MLTKFYRVYIQKAPKSRISRYLYVLSLIFLVTAYFQWERYILNPLLKLEEMHSSHGVIQAVYTGKFRSLVFNNEKFGVALSGLDRKAMVNQNAKVWYQVLKGIFGKRKIIYQIQIRDWLLRDDYAEYYREQAEYQKYAIPNIVFYIAGIVAIFVMIWIRHKDEVYDNEVEPINKPR
ncbi:hypothetical protein ACM66T_07505 [Sulfurimonas sp. ST-25]|uniref:hypothetical protein n=1 Tax=Sulfurimonas sp. ST-25 TaxID=3400151 RepID=UPI003A88ECFD